MTDNEKAAKQAERELREMMRESGTGQVEVAEETGLMDEMIARGPVVVTVDGGGSSSGVGLVKATGELDDDDTNERDMDDMEM